MATTDADKILSNVRSVLLVDWPNAGVPRALLEAGFTVFGASPGRYSSLELASKPPADADGVSVLPIENDGFLVFRKLATPPPSVDAVAIYRPAEEIPAIIASQVIPLQARIVWLQPPVSSPEGRRIADDRGLEFVEGVDIAATARQLTKK